VITTLPPQPSTGEVKFAPYFDVNLQGPSLFDVYTKSGQKDFVLAFAIGSSEGCVPKWGGQVNLDDPSVIGPIRQIQAVGGRLIAATGGAMGMKLMRCIQIECSNERSAYMKSTYTQVLTSSNYVLPWTHLLEHTRNFSTQSKRTI